MANTPAPLPPSLASKAKKIAPVVGTVALVIGLAADAAHVAGKPELAGPLVNIAQIVSWVGSLFGV